MAKGIEKIGQQMVEFLARQSVCLEHDEDGRLESLKSEDNLTDLLRKEFENQIEFLPKGHNRAFGDIDIKVGDKVYPINVKMVDPNKSGAFNGGGPKVFNYVLFGETTSQWKPLAKRVRESTPDKLARDYYYLIYYKRSDKKPIFISLADIHKDSVVTNPSNPIQLKKDVRLERRNPEQKVDFIVELLTDVCRKKAQAYMILTGESFGTV